jgi:hypothetical protein
LTEWRQDAQTRQAAAAGGHGAAGGRFGALCGAGRSQPLDRPDAGEGGGREFAIGATPGRVRGFSQFERAAATGLSRPGRETAIAAFCHRFTLRQMRRTVESYALK